MRDAAFDEGKTIVGWPREDDITVRVDIDETRCDDFARCVDHGVGVYALRLIDADDAPVEDRNVGVSLRGTGAVDHATVADGDVYSQRFPLPSAFAKGYGGPAEATSEGGRSNV